MSVVYTGKDRLLLQSTPAVQNAAYADGDIVAIKTSLNEILATQGGTAKITDIIILDRGTPIKKGLRCILFNNSDALTAAINAAFVLDANTTIANYLGEGHAITADYEDIGTADAVAHCNKNADWSDIIIKPKLDTSYTIYYVLVASEILTPSAVNDFTLTFVIERD